MPSEIVFWMEELSESLIAGSKAPQRTDGHERVYDGLEGRYLTRQLPTFQGPIRVVITELFFGFTSCTPVGVACFPMHWISSDLI